MTSRQDREGQAKACTPSQPLLGMAILIERGKIIEASNVQLHA
jgi:hypothetical protein